MFGRCGVMRIAEGADDDDDDGHAECADIVGGAGDKLC